MQITKTFLQQAAGIFVLASFQLSSTSAIAAQADAGYSSEKQKTGADVTVLPEMTVTSERGAVGYSVPNATTATKTDTPIFDTPVSIQVVPREVMDDQQVIRLEDVTRNVSGVQRSFGFGDVVEEFIIRGFRTDFRNQLFRDGFRIRGVGFSETANLERVEVLKGPAAVLFGRVEPGGIINKVSKRPLPGPYYSLQQQFGSFDLYRTLVDATGPIPQDRSLSYRFNLAYINSNSFRDNVFLDRIFVSPSVAWRPREGTEVNLTLDYQNQDTIDDEGIPAIGNRPAPLPISRNFCDPECKDETEIVSVYFNWSHRLSNAWTIRNGVVASLSEFQFNELFNSFLSEDNRTLALQPVVLDEPEHRYSVYLEAIRNLQLLGMEHTLLFGSDYFNNDRESTTHLGDTVTNDIFNPVRDVADFAALEAQAPNSFTEDDDEWFGIYFQDQIKILDALHVLGGGRYDWAETISGFSTTSRAAIVEQEKDVERFSPRVGLVYQPWSWVALYGNYVESFGANNAGLSATGESFDPETATQYEVGIKTDMFGGRLRSTLAFYNLTKENVLTPDPNDRRFSLVIGEAESQGIELDLTGQVTDSLSIIGTYAFTDTEITKDTRGNEGNRLPLAPRHAGSLWAKYQVLSERLEVGAGVFAVGQREGDNENTFQLPGYARVDAFAAYHWKIGPSRLTAQVNINNLLDKEYFQASNVFFGNPRAGILPGEPLTVLGSLRLEF